MVIKHSVEGYDEYLRITKELDDKKVVFYVLFTGSLDASGKSWCKDCVAAEPLIDEVINKLPDSIHFVVVHVGQPEYWKDQNCPFRKDKKAHVSSIPTVIRWGGPQRLEGADLENPDVISMAFEDD
ncbi:thioredoxin domain-containing protein 17-like [Macrosteles quadrilineatus]|uniref:thioredoxin domain-containing protein 17-like n=1 Tax=Macrosteles quadrilineatus TaxID=74068 RepID=UPI0023E2DE20|nr:thioredoxin domain-containing protein 17-like [Macrosteles quadrilineatus]